MLASLLVVFLVCLCLALFATWYPHIRLRWSFRRKYGKTGGRLPPFVPFPLPFFGHSLQLYPSQEPFVLRNHQKFGPAFGFYLQDLPVFCLDIANYQRELNSNPKVISCRDELPPIISPFISFPKLAVHPILRGTYAEQLKMRMGFVQKQLESFLHHEFPDPNKTYTRTSNIFQTFTACYTLAAFCNLEFSDMQKYNAIQKLADYTCDVFLWRDKTLVLPRLAFLARLAVKKYRKMTESYIVPLLPLLKKNTDSNTSDNVHKDDTSNQAEADEEAEEGDGKGDGKGKEAKYLLEILRDHIDREKNIALRDEIIDDMIVYLPQAMSIYPTVQHLFALLIGTPEFLSRVEEEQKQVYKEDGNNFTSSRLSKMLYLDAALKETLRLEFTLASFRHVTEDITLHDGFVLPGGTHFILTGSAINYDEALFPNSHSWLPERWVEIAESQKGLKFSQRKEAFIWGTGKIICPGRTHATIGMKLMTSLILRNFSCWISGPEQYSFKARKIT